MTEGTPSVREILFGLEEYSVFKQEEEHAVFLREFIKILDSENIETAILEYCIKHLNKKDQLDKLFRSIIDYKKKVDGNAIYDAFSRSQIKSKIWLINELAKISSTYNNVVILAAWFGQLKHIYDNKISYKKIRVVELDKSACETSDYIFNISDLESYKVKSICADINNLTLHKNGYEWEVKNFNK